MFRSRKGKRFFKDRVKKLLRTKKNHKLRMIINNEEAYPSLIDSTGTSLLHLAAKFDNEEMIQYSISIGCDVDGRDSTGTTPLMIATKFNHCLAMKRLLDANADIFASNMVGEYPLQLMFDRNKTVFYSSVIKYYLKKVQDRYSNDEEVADVLMRAGCSLDQLVIMQNPTVTRIFLDKTDRLDEIISCRGILISMFLVDCNNLEILMRHGPQLAQRIDDFLWYLHDMCTTGIIKAKQVLYFKREMALETFKEFTTKTIEWGILDQQNLKFIKYMFEDANESLLEMLLKTGIHVYIQNRFDYNVVKHVFGNRNPGVIQLLKGINCKINERSTSGQEGTTALHIAVFRCVPENVKLLLNMGADPNAADEYGETPLFCVLNAKEPLIDKLQCINLLLQSNADVEVCDNLGYSFIEYIDYENEEHLALVEPVLAHLAIRDLLNSLVKPSILHYIDKRDSLRCYYNSCKDQLIEMKSRNVARSFSLITVLTKSPDDIARFVGAQIGKIIEKLMRGDSLKLNSYYSQKFKDHLDRALKIYKLRSQMYDLIAETIPFFHGCLPVLDSIISNFDFEELLAFTGRN